MGNKKTMNLAFAIVGASLFNVGEVSAQTFFQCIACEAGTYESNGKCVKCPSGTFSSISGATSSSACQPCTEGHYCPEGAQVEYSCPKGTYSNSQNATSCNKCSRGQYNDKVAQTSCKSCSGYTYSDTEGSERCKYWDPLDFGIFYGKEDGTYTKDNKSTIIYSEEIPKAMCEGYGCGKYDNGIWCRTDLFYEFEEPRDPAPKEKKVCGLSLSKGRVSSGGCGGYGSADGYGIKYVVATENTEIHIDDGYASNIYGYYKIWGNRGTYYIYPDGHIETTDKYYVDIDAK